MFVSVTSCVFVVFVSCSRSLEQTAVFVSVTSCVFVVLPRALGALNGLRCLLVIPHVCSLSRGLGALNGLRCL